MRGIGVKCSLPPWEKHFAIAYRYVRALGAIYMRLTGTSLDCYQYLEPLYLDYRKLRRMTKLGSKCEVTYIFNVTNSKASKILTSTSYHMSVTYLTGLIYFFVVRIWSNSCRRVHRWIAERGKILRCHYASYSGMCCSIHSFLPNIKLWENINNFMWHIITRSDKC